MRWAMGWCGGAMGWWGEAMRWWGEAMRWRGNEVVGWCPTALFRGGSAIGSSSSRARVDRILSHTPHPTPHHTPRPTPHAPGCEPVVSPRLAAIPREGEREKEREGVHTATRARSALGRGVDLIPHRSPYSIP